MKNILKYSITLTLWILSCSDPVSFTEKDIVELERVWQYMKVFSLYQDRLPSHKDALSFDSPWELVNTIHDTMLSSTGDHYNVGMYLPYCIENGPLGARSSLGAYELGSVRVEKLTNQTVYVRISDFDDSLASCMRQFSHIIQSAPNLIIDLAANRGGSLEQCTAAVELILPANKQYLVAKRRVNILSGGDTGTVEEVWQTHRTGDGWEGRKMAVLINDSSASAAEIMAVALRDVLPNSTTLVGERTLGKGIGQYVFCFKASSAAMLRLTGFRFYRILSEPDNDYHEKGIRPDHEVLGNKESMIKAAGDLLEEGFSSRVSDSELRKINAAQKVVRRDPVSGCQVRIDVDGDMLF